MYPHQATKGKNEIPFFSLPEFERWRSQTDNVHTWKIKYYKGLGTSTGKEAKEYFSDMDRHRIPFKYEGAQDDQAIELASLTYCTCNHVYMYMYIHACTCTLVENKHFYHTVHVEQLLLGCVHVHVQSSTCTMYVFYMKIHMPSMLAIGVETINKQTLVL